jgi:hypothetical protein
VLERDVEETQVEIDVEVWYESWVVLEVELLVSTTMLAKALWSSKGRLSPRFASLRIEFHAFSSEH